MPYGGAQLGLLSLTPSKLAGAYFKGHLLGRAREWYEIFESALVQNTATDFGQLKVALTKIAVRNRNDLEIQYYSSEQSRNQEPTDFLYDLLKVHKKLGLSMWKEALVDHIFARLELQVQDYVEVGNPKTTAQLLEAMAKFAERYSCKEMQGSRNSDNVGRRGWNERRMSNDDSRMRNWREAESSPQWSQRDRGFENGNRVITDNGRFNANTRRYESRNLSRGDQRNRSSSENFSRGGRLNVLKVKDDQNDQSQSATDVPMKVSAICLSPVEFPYVPILLNETFLQRHYGLQTRKNHLYPRISIGNIFFYKQVKKSLAQVITAQGAKCQNVRIIELQVRIKEFVKHWMFHVLAYLEYPCILGVDVISGSKIVLDFDREKRWRFRIRRLKKLLQRLRKEMWK
ncbi:uncharacterized protein TNCV_3871871 [Trichonephila clavipes]|nr:uncharacterized protein TNCV_3871871 [Trichonephila clavipes]